MTSHLSPIQPMRHFHVLQHAVNCVSYRLEGIGSLFGNELLVGAHRNYQGQQIISSFVTACRHENSDTEQVHEAGQPFPESGKIDDKSDLN